MLLFATGIGEAEALSFTIFITSATVFAIKFS